MLMIDDVLPPRVYSQEVGNGMHTRKSPVPPRTLPSSEPSGNPRAFPQLRGVMRQMNNMVWPKCISHVVSNSNAYAVLHLHNPLHLFPLVGFSFCYCFNVISGDKINWCLSKLIQWLIDFLWRASLNFLWIAKDKGNNFYLSICHLALTIFII